MQAPIILQISDTMEERIGGTYGTFGIKWLLKFSSPTVIYYYYYYYYYLLQFSFHSVAAVLTLVQTKQIRINIHKRNNTKHINTSTLITQTSTQLSKHPHITKPTHTHTHTLQNPHIYTHPHITKPTHTHTHTLQNKLQQPQYKIHTK